MNNTHSPLDPGLLWRVNNAIATRQPVVARVKLPLKKGEVVYEVFAQKEVPDADVHGAGGIAADLRFSQARLYAVLPRAIGNVELLATQDVKPGQPIEWAVTVPGIRAELPLRAELRDGNGEIVEERYSTTGGGNIHGAGECGWAGDADRGGAGQRDEGLRRGPARYGRRTGKEPYPPNAAASAVDQWFGPRLRDLAVSADGAVALVNAFDWGQNLYCAGHCQRQAALARQRR